MGDQHELVFVVFRLMAAVLVLASAIFGTYSLYRHRLSPRPVWAYSAVVLWFVAIYRWGIVILLTDPMEDVYSHVAPWIAPMNQTMYALLVMVIATLTYACIRSHRIRDQLETTLKDELGLCET